MKIKYVKMNPIGGFDYYIKMIKDHWWSRWKICRSGNLAPDMYELNKNGEYCLI